MFLPAQALRAVQHAGQPSLSASTPLPLPLSTLSLCLLQFTLTKVVKTTLAKSTDGFTTCLLPLYDAVPLYDE